MSHAHAHARGRHAHQGRRRRRLWRRLTSVTAAVVASTLTVGVGWAYWTAGSTAGGGGASSAATVGQGATPTASASGSAVTVSWSASTLSNGQAVDGYRIARYDVATLTSQPILSACSGTVAALTCTESGVPDGQWAYSVTPAFATNWLGAESARSNAVTVAGSGDTTAPTNAISLSSVTGGAGKNGDTIYYRGADAGSFTLTNAVSDADSGPASSSTAALTGTSTGWTHTASTVSTPAGGPYVSSSFSWTAGTTTSPTEVVTGRDVAGNTVATTLSFVDDSTTPIAGSVTYTNGYQPGLSVVVTFTSGSDGGSGVATQRLQRASAPLTAGTCGSFGSFTDLAPADPASPYTDRAVANGTCYQYRFVTTDRAGNQAIATSANIAKVDYAGAVAGTAGILSHWRLGETNPAIATDSFTGTNGTALTSRSGELGATWTYHFGGDNEQIVDNRITSTDAGRAIYSVGVVPSSPNYAVSADLYVKSLVTGDRIGVVGRLTASTPTFYMARYELADQSWNIVKYSGTTPSWLNYVTGQALTVGQTYRVRLEMTGTNPTTLRLFVNGVLTVSATDSSSPLTVVGRAGFMEGEYNSTTVRSTAGGIHLDNFQVTELRAADSVGTNHGAYVNGTTVGAAGAIVGDTNAAPTFDGVNDYVQATGTSGIPVGSSLRSVEAWFRTTSSARQVLFSYGTRANTQEFGLWLNSGGTAMTAWGYGAGNDKTFTLPAAVNDGAWHHIVKTYDGTSITLYIDGVALTPQAATRGTVMDSYGFGIGAVIVPGDSNSGGYFAGSIDEVSLYTTALNQTTVTNHYELGRSSPA